MAPDVLTVLGCGEREREKPPVFQRRYLAAGSTIDTIVPPVAGPSI